MSEPGASPHLRAGAVLVTTDYPSRRRGHADPWVHELARHLVASGIPTKVITPQRLPAARRTDARIETVDGVEVHRPRFLSPGARRPLERARVQLSHRNYLAAVTGSAKRLPTPAFYAGCFLRPAGASAVEIGRRHGRPAFILYEQGENRDRADEIYSIAANASVFQRAAGVIAVSEELASIALERYEVDAARVVVLPNAVDVGRFSPGSRHRARRELGIPAHTFVVAFVGRFDVNKGARRLAAAVDLLDGDVLATFIGSGALDPRTRHPSIVRQVDHRDVSRYLHAADVFASPSLEEGCSVAVIEAMACGLPVVVSDRPFSRAIVDDANGLFVDPLDPDAIAAALRSLQCDADRRRTMGQAARARAEQYPIAQRVRDVLDWVGARVATFDGG